MQEEAVPLFVTQGLAHPNIQQLCPVERSMAGLKGKEDQTTWAARGRGGWSVEGNKGGPKRDGAENEGRGKLSRVLSLSESFLSDSMCLTRTRFCLTFHPDNQPRDTGVC